jgi:hypothetical protein
MTPQIKTRVTFASKQPGPYTALVDASTNVEVDVVFQPDVKSALGNTSANMKITGPGPVHDWGFTTPLKGTVRSGLVAQPAEVWANDSDGGASINVIVSGIDAPVTGTLGAGSVLPPGVSVVPQNISVGAGGVAQTHLWLNFNGIPADGKFRPLELAFKTPNGSTSTQIKFAAVSGTIEVNSGDRGDCGVSRVSLSLSIEAPRQVLNSSTPAGFNWVMLGWNLDLLKARYVWMGAESGGIPIFSYTMAFPAGNSNQVRENSVVQAELHVSPEEWARIVKGPFRFGCAQTDSVWASVQYQPPPGVKWAPAVKGLKF